MVTANMRPVMSLLPLQGCSFLAWICLPQNRSGVCDKCMEGGLGGTCSGFGIFSSPSGSWSSMILPCKYLLCFKPRLISYELIFFTQITDWVWLFTFSSTHLQSLSTLAVTQYHQRALSALWTATASIKHRACLGSPSLDCNSNYRWGCQTTSH